MRRFLFILALIGIGGLLAIPVSAQDYKKMREELSEKQRNTRVEIRKLEDQIEDFQTRLKLTQEKYDSLYKQYEDLNRLIALQDQKLNKLQEEQKHLNEEIDITEIHLAETQQELEILIENYKQTLSYIYKHGRTSQLALIFSANSINQMLVRAHYLNEFQEYREEQARQVREKQEELERTKKELAADREQNEKLLTEIREERENLDRRHEQQRKNVELIKRDKNLIQDKLQQHNRQLDKLENVLASLTLEIDKIRKAQEIEIRRQEAIRKQNLADARNIEDAEEREKAIAEYSKPIRNSSYFEREPQIESAFEEARGNLPWPVESRTISEHFGRKRHPVYGTYIPNPGIEIVTKNREEVRAVHDGYVWQFQPIPGYGDVVVIGHGKYFTAYGNLSEVLVRSKTVVEKGDIIGFSGNKSSPKGQTIFFMIRENNSNLNPEKWLDGPDT